MKKYIAYCLLIAGLFIGFSAQSFAANTNKRMHGDVQAVRLPAGTTMKLELLDEISSRMGDMGDEFSAMLKEDKIVDGQIALPAGSVLRGTINKITPAKRLSRSAVVYFSFDHIVTPNGKQVPITAGLYGYSEITLDGGVYSGGNYGYAIQQNWENTKNIVSKAIDWGKGTGENMQYLCVPVGAVGGSIGGIIYYVGADIVDLFKKGNEVVLAPGTNITILLTHPLDIPLH